MRVLAFAGLITIVATGALADAKRESSSELVFREAPEHRFPGQSLYNANLNLVQRQSNSTCPRLTTLCGDNTCVRPYSVRSALKAMELINVVWTDGYLLRRSIRRMLP